VDVVTPDPEAIWAWLERLYEHFDEGEWLTLFSLDRTTGQRHVDWLDIGDYDTIAECAARRAATADVWHGVATRRARLPHGRGSANDCAHLPGLWLDVDIAGPGHKGGHTLPPDVDLARELIAAYPLEPTVVVHSGGGLQAWWLFPEPLPAADAGPLLTRWGATWADIGRQQHWHVDNVFDIARIMRLPGTINRKVPGDPRPVVVIETSEEADGG